MVFTETCINSTFKNSVKKLYNVQLLNSAHILFLTVLGGAPFPEVLQYRVDAWSGRSKPLFHLPAPKINLIYGARVGHVSDIKLIRTDTTLDLSQKAEKRYPQMVNSRNQILWDSKYDDGEYFTIVSF